MESPLHGGSEPKRDEDVRLAGLAIINPGGDEQSLVFNKRPCLGGELTTARMHLSGRHTPARSWRSLYTANFTDGPLRRKGKNNWPRPHLSAAQTKEDKNSLMNNGTN